MNEISSPLTDDEATSNDAWGPSGTDMSDIARATYNKFVSSGRTPLMAQQD